MADETKLNPSVLMVVKNKRTHWTDYAESGDIVDGNGKKNKDNMEALDWAIAEIEKLKAENKDLREIVKTLALMIKSANLTSSADSVKIETILNTLAVLTAEEE